MGQSAWLCYMPAWWHRAWQLRLTMPDCKQGGARVYPVSTEEIERQSCTLMLAMSRRGLTKSFADIQTNLLQQGPAVWEELP